MSHYDCIIVGAGPSGYMCAYELVKKSPGLKVLLIDKGKDVEHRFCPVLNHLIERCPVNKAGVTGCHPSCSMTCGFGGAGAFSDGKFNITTEFGGWLDEFISDEELIELIKYADNINLEFGATPIITDPYTPKIREIERKAMGAGLKLLRAKVRHLGTEENLKILSKIYNYLKDKIEIRHETFLKDLIIENSQIKGIVVNDDEKIFADNVVLGLGRDGSIFLSELLSKYGVEMINNRVDIGVRVETSNVVMQEINENLYEGKFVYYTSNGVKVRTFCSNPSGHVVLENDHHVILANGHSYQDPKLGSENTNFALLVSHKFSEPFNDPNSYAYSLAKLANKLSCGSVILQRFGDIMLQRRSTEKRIKEGFVVPTLKEAVPGDLALCLPYKTLSALIEMIKVLDKVTPGIANDDTLFYGVEAKFYSARVDVDKTLMVKNINNLYVVGDGAGITRGLAQASACGIYVARTIAKKEGK